MADLNAAERALLEAGVLEMPSSGPSTMGTTVLDRARRYVDKVPPAVEGQGGDEHTFKLCCRLIRGLGLTDDETLDVLRPWNARCVPPWTERELLTKIRSARKSGREPLGGLLHQPRSPRNGNGAAAEEPLHPPAVPRARPVIVRLSDVMPEPIDWLWTRRLARGKSTMIGGDPGQGKSSLTIDVAARITSERAWPDGGCAPAGDVLFLCVEDGLADTVRPRVDAMGGDPSRVYVLDGVIDAESGNRRVVNLAKDLEAVKTALETVRPVLTVIDPITAYLGRIDAYKDAEVRGLLTPLVDLIRQFHTALITVAHLSKDQQRAALHRPGGSIAFIASARLAFVIAPDPDDDDRRVIAPLKENISAAAPSLAFRLPDGCVTWEPEPVSLTAKTLLRPPGHDAEDLTDAERLVRELLEEEPWPYPAKEALEKGKASGIAERTMQRAARRLGVRPIRRGFGREACWVWHRPAIPDIGATKTPPPCSVAPMAPMEE